MSAVPCIQCADQEREMLRATRFAERRQRRGLPITQQLEEIKRAKANLASCEHGSMERARQSTIDRHARAREEQ